jgi:hypothetical protein
MQRKIVQRLEGLLRALKESKKASTKLTPGYVLYILKELYGLDDRSAELGATGAVEQFSTCEEFVEYLIDNEKRQREENSFWSRCIIRSHRSFMWRLWDTVRWFLILTGDAVIVYLLWKVHWIVAVILAFPVHRISLNFFGFLTLRLYDFTPEAKATRTYHEGLQKSFEGKDAGGKE